MPRALPKVLKSKTVTTQGELRQVGLRLSSATPLSPAWPGRLPMRRTPPARVAAATRECRAGRRAASRRAALCGGTGPGATGRAVSPGLSRHFPQNRAPRRPRSPPHGPAAASASQLWPEARRPPPGARKLRVPRAGGRRGVGGVAGPLCGWLVELGAQAPWGPGLGVLTVWGEGAMEH